MNLRREAVKMGVPARHRERSGEAGGPPGNRRVLVSVPDGTSQGELVLSVAEGTPEDARLPAPLPARRASRPEGRAYSSERRTVISTVGAADS